MTGVRRRTFLGGVGLLALAGCAAPFAGARLVIATGFPGGVYFVLGGALAQVWTEQLGLTTPPEVRATVGSVENVMLLATGGADVVISQVDVAATRLVADGDPRAPRALARIYDDVLHVVVPAASPIRSVAQLRGARVSVGAPDSGVSVVAGRVLTAAGIGPGDLRTERLGLDDSANAMEQGLVDAFFWSGGLTTPRVMALADVLPIRLLDLEADRILGAVRGTWPEYAPGTVPAMAYRGCEVPVTTLLVRNVLMVPASMADDLAGALVGAVFAAKERLIEFSRPTLTVDPRAAIGTQPVPLHPGAARFYQEEKD